MASKIKVFMKQKTTQDQHSPRMNRNRAALARSRSIDHQISDEREKKKNEVQLLILGGASSGKSTFTKQLRLHHGDGFPPEERQILQQQVYVNLSDALNTVLEQMVAWGVEFSHTDNQEFSLQFKKKFPHVRHDCLPSSPTSPSPDGRDNVIYPTEGSTVYFPEPVLTCSTIYRNPHNAELPQLSDFSKEILELWNDAGVQYCYSKRQEFFPKKLYPAEEYVLENICRLCESGYIPSIQDVLYIRCPTVGVQEHHFTINGLMYRVIDVAGQKNQRKKWIHFFEGVKAVIFFVALSGYCENLEEAPSLNSMDDSLKTYCDVINNKFLEKTDFILFLNKKDIFERRLRYSSLTEKYPEYTGKTPEDGISFIKEKFAKKCPKNKESYIHISCAIDAGLMKTLIADVMDIIVESNLKRIKQL